MKKLLVLLLFSVMAFGLASNASAALVTYSFDPNDWITNYSTDAGQTRSQQDNPRLYISASGKYYATYNGSSYSADVSGYVSQAQNIQIHSFNMWLADGINAVKWGEVLTQVKGSIPSGTATNGWVAEIIDNPWPQAGYGSKLIQWYDAGYYDDDSSTAANPLTFGNSGINFGNFTLTVDVNLTDFNGEPVDLSSPQRIWLGTMTDSGERLEGTMNMNPVPEPCTMILIGAGLGGAAIFRKRLLEN